MKEYMIRELTGDPDKLFTLLERSGMAVLYHQGCFLYVLRGAAGWFLLSHQPGQKEYVKKLLIHDKALRQTALGAEALFHVDGVLRHDLYTLTAALEKEILRHGIAAPQRAEKVTPSA